MEKGEASSTTCSPKPDSVLSETVTTSVNSSTPSQDTDSDPNVSSTTGLDSKKKVDINKDIKTIKKEFDSLTSFKEKKEVGEELFAPSATIIQQIKPKYNKIEKKPQSSSKYNDIFSMNDVKKSKDKLVKDRASSGKDAKKDKMKVKQRFQTNDLKDFLAADSKQTIKRAVVTDKKPESKEKVETKRRLSVNSENDELEPKAKIPKLKSDSDGESEAKKPKSEPMKPMGRIPKIEKKEDKRERTESVKSHDSNNDKDKHKSHSKSKSKHEDRHRHKSSTDRPDDKNRDKHKKKKKEKDRDRDRERELKAKLDPSKSRALSFDEEKHQKKMKKSKDKSKDKEKRDLKSSDTKDKSRDKDRKDKHRDKDKERERKRKKEDDDRRKQTEQVRKKKKMDNSSQSDGSGDDSTDVDAQNFSIFDEPVFDENNPVYFSMYDKVKARRSCVKAREEEGMKRQEEALKKFAKLKEQRAKREGKKVSVDSEEESMSGDEEIIAAMLKEKEMKKKQSFINSSSDSDDEASEVKQKKKSKSVENLSENRKHSSYKAKRTFMDSSDDDSDEGQKPLMSASLSKIGLDTSESDNNRSPVVDAANASSISNKKHPSYLETDSEQEGSDSKIKSSKTVKTESDLSDSNKEAILKTKSSISDTDSDLEESKSNALAILSKNKNKSKDKSIKAEPLSSDSEDEKPDISKCNNKKEIKSEPKPSGKDCKTSLDSKSKSTIQKRDKKKNKDDGMKEKSLLGQKLKRASLFGTSSEDESTARNTKPPTPNTKEQPATAKVVKKLQIEAAYSDSDSAKMLDSPAIESDSSDGIPSRPLTPNFPSMKSEESKSKSKQPESIVITSPKKEQTSPVIASQDRKKETDKMFDSLLTINVDCQSRPSSKKSPGCSSLKSPGGLKSPGKAGPLLSPGNHRSPMISPSGKPTYLLAHMHDKARSMEAEKIHREQERGMHKRGTEKVSKEGSKLSKKDSVVIEKKTEKISKLKEHPEKSSEDNHLNDSPMIIRDDTKKETETLCLSESDSDSNDNPKKGSPNSETSVEEIQEVKAVPAEPRRKSMENESKKSKSKPGSRQTSDESNDDYSLVIDLDNKKDKQSVFDFNDDSEDNFGASANVKQSLDAVRKPLRESFKTSQKPSGTSYASFVAGTQNEASSSPSTSTEFKVVTVPDSPPQISNGIDDKSSQDDLVIIEKPTESAKPRPDQLEMSIASITENKQSEDLSESDAAVAALMQSNAEADRKRTVISQEETESAVNALLGESFDSFEGATDPANQQQVENMDQDVNNVADDEAAAAVAGLATAMSPEDGEDWSRPVQVKNVEKEQAAAVTEEDKQEDESIENIAAEIRRSSTEEKRSEEVKPPEKEVKKIEVPKSVETSQVKETEAEIRKSREDVFDFQEEEEEASPSASKASTTIVPTKAGEAVSEETPKPEMRTQQTRVLPIPRSASTKCVTPAVTLSSPSTLITPVSIVTSSPSSPATAEPSQPSPMQPLRLSIDEKLSPSMSSSSPLSRSPRPRMRRSTGGNSRESEEESAVTEQKIHLILEQAKQEAERSAAAAAHHRPVVPLSGFRVAESGLPMNLISQPSQNQSEVLIDPKTGQTVRITNPTSSVTLTLVTNSQSQSPESRAASNQMVAKPGIPQPTVLPPRNDTVRPSQTRVVPASASQATRPASQVTQVTQARQALPIQLPTQPLPPESVRKTQPVLLEPNSKLSPPSTNLPRSVSLPTEPVPMSVASKMPSLPRTPLPMTTAQTSHVSSHLPGHVVVTSRTMSQSLATTSPTSRHPVVTASSGGQHKLGVSSQFLAQEQGQRVSLGKREEEREMDTKGKDHSGDQPLALHSPQVKVQRDYLQPRDREVNRPASTPSQPEKEEKPTSAHLYPGPGVHPSMFENPGLDSRTLELLRLADYKYRLELTQQLLANGYPEHMVPTYVEKIVREKFLTETVLSQTARGHEEATRPGSVPPGIMHHLEELRLAQPGRQPLPAHAQASESVHHYRADSPLYHPGSAPYNVPPSAHQEHFRGGQPPVAHSSQSMRLNSGAPSPGLQDLRSRPASPTYAPTSDYTLPHLAQYPICWAGTLGLKNDMANIRMHYVSGNRDLARAAMPDNGSTLKIMQRMRLEDSQLDGVARKMETKGEHCMLLALPNASDHEEIELQSRNLRHSFITYLQLKSAAGIVNVSNEDNQPAYIVHVFPSCDFANENLARYSKKH